MKNVNKKAQLLFIVLNKLYLSQNGPTIAAFHVEWGLGRGRHLWTVAVKNTGQKIAHSSYFHGIGLSSNLQENHLTCFDNQHVLLIVNMTFAETPSKSGSQN